VIDCLSRAHVEEWHFRYDKRNRCCPRCGKHFDDREVFLSHVRAAPVSDKECPLLGGPEQPVAKAKEHPEYGYWDDDWKDAKSPEELKAKLLLDGGQAKSGTKEDK
jgi:hypothetical protein